MAARRRGSITRRKKAGVRGYYPGWWCRYMKPGGGRTWAYGGETPEEAEATLARLLASAGAVKVEGVPALQPSPAPSPRLADFLADEYIDLLRTRLSPGSFSMSSGHVLDFARFLGEKRIHEVTRADVDGYVHHRLTKGPVESKARRKDGTMYRRKSGANTVRKVLYSIAVCFESCIDRGYATVNPCRGVRLPKVHEKPVLPEGLVPLPDMERVIAATAPRPGRAFPDRRGRPVRDFTDYRPILTFLLWTGMRIGEAINLGWSAVAKDLSTVTVIRSKSGKPRKVPILPPAQEILRTQFTSRGSVNMVGTTPVFPGVDRNNALKRLKAAAKKVLVRDLRVHDLRHEFAEHALLAGVPDTTVARALGHRDTRLLASRYGCHASPGEMEILVERMEAYRRAQTAKAAQETPQAQSA